ncbi:MAG: class I SAM-dependent methyltransferase [Candidatus Paceibacterota bacterium]
MEERKIKEIEYYNKNTNQELRERDFEGFDSFSLESYRFLKDFFIKNFKGKRILDFGCGNGIHTFWLQDYGEVIGIDLSDNSLNIARKIAKKAKFIKMDCEKLDFPDNSFDIVFDGGTFSSLDFDKALEEIIRVLKKDGTLVGIETLGHNPILNLKRKLKRIAGKRTKWAERHIFKINDFKKTKERFTLYNAYFFHLFSWIAFPFLDFKTGKNILEILQKMDSFFISLFPFLKKYSFKIVFVFKNPKK